MIEAKRRLNHFIPLFCIWFLDFVSLSTSDIVMTIVEPILHIALSFFWFYIDLSISY